MASILNKDDQNDDIFDVDEEKNQMTIMTISNKNFMN